VPIRGTGVPATGRTPHRSRRARTVRGRRKLQYRSRRPRDLRAERRTARARVRRPRPRDGGVPQLPHHPRATRTRVLPDRTPDRFPTVRRPHDAGRIGGRCRMTMPTRHTTPSSVYQRWDARLGLFTLRPVDPPTDTPLLHRWLTDPKSAYWLMTHATPDEVEREFTEIALAAGRKAFLGLYRNRPEFLVETYAPLRSTLAGMYPARPGDVGMHFLIAPTETPVRGFSRAVLTTVMELLFTDPATERVVVEPDVGNTPVH